MRLKFTLAYEGAAFRGWQSQKGGGSVQDVLQEAIGRLLGGGRVSVQGSGRTDAGVHALRQTAHVDVPPGRRPADWLRALNAILPPSLRVLACARCRENFHARYAATGKTYEYVLWTGPVLPPHWAGRSWHVHSGLDVAVLRRAAILLAGRHDFRGYSANRGSPVADSVRHLRSVTVRGRGPLIRLRFEGDGFLYKMARMLAAAMVEAARGRATLDDLRDRLEGRGRAGPRTVAPAGGLYLVRVDYRRPAQSG
ncbi:MAG: tRNA pseudouridine(38-40) synthase TruA [Chthoniobacterales bacterium]